jgi:hypothetical protein
MTCQALRDSIAIQYDPARSTLVPPAAAQALLDAMVISIADRSVSLVSAGPEGATVRIDVVLAYSASDDALLAYLRAVESTADPSPASEVMDVALGVLRMNLASQALVPEASVVVENGGWLVCTDLVTLTEIALPD